MTEYARALPGTIRRRLTADPTPWLLKARSPLVRFRAAVGLLGWPADGPKAAAWRESRCDDADLAAILGAQRPDGLWRAPERFLSRRGSLITPRYRATVWQLPPLADLGVTLAEGRVAAAVEVLLARRTKDGFFDLGPGGAVVIGNALVVSSLAAFGVGTGELAAARRWLAGRQRPDGGWADLAELATPDEPSTIGTTAEVVRALVTKGESVSSVRRGSRYLLDNLFTDYNGRFPPTAKFWFKLSWPQYRYDALTVATALAAGGAPRAALAPLVEVVRGLQKRRGFWRQQLVLGADGWFDAVAAGRASRWITFRAAAFLLWFYESGPPKEVAA